jgi:Zn-finger nucleic acid-binding protein
MSLLSLLKSVFGGARPTGPTYDPRCPVCQVDLVPIEGAGRTARCATCAGLWVDNGCFSALVAAEDLDARLLEHGGDGAHTFGPSDKRRCAVCEERMDNYQFQYQSGVWIDACPRAHGFWLDGAELQLIREWRAAGSAPVAVARVASRDPRALGALAAMDAAIEGNREVARFMERVEELRREERERANRYRESGY